MVSDSKPFSSMIARAADRSASTVRRLRAFCGWTIDFAN
jgi:hypothetical protein